MNKRITKRMKTITMVVVLACASFAMHAAELVGAGQYYPTLKSAFDDINNGTLTGNVVLQLTSNTTETGIATLYQSGYGGFSSYSKVTIYPTVSNITITGRIILSDADNVIIDGRVNQTGTTSDLTIISTSNAIGITDAQYIKIRYCTLIGSGIVLNLYGGYNTGSNFCKFSNNTIKYNDRNSTQTALLQSQPFLNGLNNHDDTVQNNNFENFCAWDDALYPNIVPYALVLRASNYGWYIEGNSFYDTGFSVVNRYSSPRAIQVALGTSTAQSACKIINNYIGGSAPMCGGSPLTITSTGTGQIQFAGISAVGSTDSVIVENNTIANIALVNNKQNANLYSYQNHLSFTGIYMYDGNGVIRNNTIGSITTPNSIVQNSTTGSDTMIAIHNNSTKTVLIEGNHIGSISGSSSTTIDATSIFGIFKKNATGYSIIKNNIIGGASQSTSLSALSTNAAFSETVGIKYTNCDSTLIDNNTIMNLNSSSNSTSGGVYGILTGSGKHVIQKNTIKELYSSNKNVNTTRPSVSGIYAYSAISALKNRIDGIYSTSTDAINCIAAGIYYSFVAYSTANENFITNVSTASTGPQSIAVGISGSFSSVINNIISLGSSSRRVYGINGEVYPNNLHNTVYIFGTANAESACFRTSGNIFNIKNNLFVNNKMNASGTSIRHFCIMINNTFYPNFVNVDYNQYYVGNVGNGGAFGRLDVNDYDVFTDYKTAFTNDDNSIESNPNFANAGGNNIIDYYPAIPFNGATTAGITNDIFNNNRVGIFWAGALQSNTPLPLTWKSFTAELNDYNTTDLIWSTSSEKNTLLFEVEKSTDAKIWTVINQQNAAGNSETEKTYKAIDNEVAFGTTYYRIKQIDMDNKYTYSTVQKVVRTNNTDVSIYPNPVMTTLNISLNNAVENTLIEIYSLEGRKIMSEKSNNLNHTINVEALAKGTYMIRISNSEKTYTSKFVRQ